MITTKAFDIEVSKKYRVFFFQNFEVFFHQKFQIFLKTSSSFQNFGFYNEKTANSPNSFEFFRTFSKNSETLNDVFFLET